MTPWKALESFVQVQYILMASEIEERGNGRKISQEEGKRDVECLRCDVGDRGVTFLCNV